MNGIWTVSWKRRENAVFLYFFGKNKKINSYVRLITGEPYLNQCPISVHSTFVYRLRANAQGTMLLRAATPYYDAHNAAVAAIVVKREHERLPMPNSASAQIDGEYMMLVHDWPHQQPDQALPPTLVDGLAKWGYGLDRDGANYAQCTRGARGRANARNTRIQPPRALVLSAKGWHNQSDVLQQSSRLPLATYRISPGKQFCASC